MNYDVVIGVGCSFMNGDRIVSKEGKNIGKEFVSGLVLSEKLECDYVHLGRTGSSNERMFKNIYEWIENNNETGHYEKPLFIIGLSGTARWMFRSQHKKKYFDLQPAHVQSYDDEALEKVNEKVTHWRDDVNELRKFMEYYMTWIYDIEEHDLKLQRSVTMLHHYLKGNNCDYRIHNSLEDSLGDIKDKINFLSFKDENYKGEDTWKGYLMWQMKNIDNEPYDDPIEKGSPKPKKYRSPFPPYGKRFCEGHPSPNANKELAERIYEDLK
jgi:hypothetical protein